jgi:epoxyqueuosine reductase
MKIMDGTLENRLKVRARELGFDLVGIAPAAPADGFDRLKEWLAAGYAGTMTYLHKHAEARHDPSAILPNVRSVVMAGMSYKSDEAGHGESPAMGKVARYARGADYHEVFWRRLERLLDWLQGERAGCRGRAVSDSAPLLERNFARRAGLGWIGKNTLLLNAAAGSYVVLGALLVDIELRADEPYTVEHCGSCRACLDACPTNAFPSPGVLDARRCVSYLTIEHKGTVSPDLRSGIGDWIFGCDVCQEVCPWNHKALPGREPMLQPRPWLTVLDAAELLSLSEEDFLRRFAGTALLRARRRGLLRNAAIVLGNAGDRSSLPALRRAVDDADAIISEAASRAIQEIERRCLSTGSAR